MINLTFSDIFSTENLIVTNAYKMQLQDILDNYDVAVFLEGKPLFFYLSMKLNHELTDHGNCRVLSSRVIDHNDLDRFRNQRVAVIDDVVVKGDSLRTVAEKLQKVGITADFYAAACEADLAENISEAGINLRGSYAHYRSSDVYRLAGLIAQYIEASMCSFNTDSPVYYFKGRRERLRSLLENKNAAVLTSDTQQIFGIESRAVYFKLNPLTAGQYDENISGSQPVVYEILSQSIIKIRVYFNDRRVVLVPFILLPPCRKNDVEQLYSLIRCPALDDLIYCCDPGIQDENMLKIVEYIYSSALMSVFSDRYHLELYRDSEIDRIQFDQYLDEIGNTSKNDILQNIFSMAEVQNTDFSVFSFSLYVRAFYEFICKLRDNGQPYRNYLGELLSEQQEDYDEFSYLVFSNQDLYDGITVNDAAGDKRVYVSSLVDIFIDMGMIVPSIVHLEPNSLVRAYKMGEYSRLTRDNINAFIKMLYNYQSDVDRSLSRGEVENLSVIFLRLFQAAYKGFNFHDPIFDDEDKYSIAYSLYGPRVSLGESLYEVKEEETLLTDFTGSKLLSRNDKGEYNVVSDVEVEDQKNIGRFCRSFAMDFSHLEKSFNGRLDQKGSQNPWNQYVHTYIQYLTLLSIGEDPRNKILSLCAELKPFLRLNSEIFFMDVSVLPIVNYKKIIFGIDSDLWKYVCYKNDALNNTTDQITDTGSDAIQGVLPFYFLNTYNSEPSQEDFLDKCGRLLFQSAFLLEEGLKAMGKSMAYSVHNADDDNEDSQNLIFSAEQYNFEGFDADRKRVEDFIRKNAEDPEFDYLLRVNYNTLRYDAQLLLDWCDLYLTSNITNCTLVNYFLVVYSKNNDLPYKLECANCISLENASEYSKVMVFTVHDQEKPGSLIWNITEELKEKMHSSDFELLLFDLRMNKHDGELCFDRVLGDGFILSGNHGKGTSVTRLVKQALAYIDTLPTESCDRINRIYSSQLDSDFNMDGLVCHAIGDSADLGDYYISPFSYRGESPMGDFNINVNGSDNNIAIGGNASAGSVEYNIINLGFDPDELLKALEEVRTVSSALSDEEKKAAEDCVSDIEEQAKSGTPDKGVIKKAIDRLKEFGKNNSQWLNAVAAVADIIGVIVAVV